MVDESNADEESPAEYEKELKILKYGLPLVPGEVVGGGIATLIIRSANIAADAAAGQVLAADEVNGGLYAGDAGDAAYASVAGVGAGAATVAIVGGIIAGSSYDAYGIAKGSYDV